jgi:hypothetical protein
VFILEWLKTLNYHLALHALVCEMMLDRVAVAFVADCMELAFALQIVMVALILYVVMPPLESLPKHRVLLSGRT